MLPLQCSSSSVSMKFYLVVVALLMTMPDRVLRSGDSRRGLQHRDGMTWDHRDAFYGRKTQHFHCICLGKIVEFDPCGSSAPLREDESLIPQAIRNRFRYAVKNIVSDNANKPLTKTIETRARNMISNEHTKSADRLEVPKAFTVFGKDFVHSTSNKYFNGTRLLKRAMLVHKLNPNDL